MQTIDLINLTADCLLILTIGVAFGHFVNLSMATYRYKYLLMALGKGPRMSSPLTVNGHEGGSFTASAPVCGSAWHETDTPCQSLPAQWRPGEL
jgi:hypothetical protein